MPPDVVGRIAAGEVVERPASVIKELAENSIDAGSSIIRINTEQGGHKLIQVIDNGCGMDRSDAILALETHATSKISNGGDVGHISTLGFRGEAIPSIASVSRFNLQTRCPDDAVGTEILVDYGIIREQRDCGCASGTNIRVSQLFGNMPARRKFLKGPESEDGHIEEMVRLLALTRPDITMVLTQNNREVIRANATNNLGMRVASILGKDMFASMIPVDYTENGIHVHGYVSTPGFTRSSRRDQRVIINGRASSADTVFWAIRDSYDSLIMHGRYPGAVIYIDLAADRVDVNVHPTKREVRFRESREVGAVVSAAIRRALRNLPGKSIDLDDYTSVRPASTLAAPPLITPEFDFDNVHASKSEETKINDVFAQISTEFPGVENKGKAVGNCKVSSEEKANSHSAMSTVQTDLPLNLPPKASVASVDLNPPIHDTFQTQPVHPPETEILSGDSENTSSIRVGLKNLRFCGRLGSRYALAEGQLGLVVVNLRAAHQRIIFEKMLNNMKTRSVPRQQLLIPVTLALGLDDARFMKSELGHFSELGFDIEQFGGNTYVVAAVPAAFDNQDVSAMVRDILDDLRRSSVTNRQSTIHLAQAACRHAVSANANLSDEEIKSIMKQLSECEMPYTCPNGHPTMVHITYSELEKRFKA